MRREFILSSLFITITFIEASSMSRDNGYYCPMPNPNNELDHEIELSGSKAEAIMLKRYCKEPKGSLSYEAHKLYVKCLSGPKHLLSEAELKELENY